MPCFLEAPSQGTQRDQIAQCLQKFAGSKRANEQTLPRASQAQKARLLQLVPLGRLSRPEEYAALAVYLASDEHHLEWAPVSIFLYE